MTQKQYVQLCTPRTKAIVPVHYAGVGCEMDAIMDLAHQYGLWVIEDAAQGVMAAYKGRPLGSIGHLGAVSFHETKNLIAGEGGALLINAPQWAERAEIIREKGTNRSQFIRGQVDKYTWVDMGSSYLPGEIVAAFLWAQLEQAESLTQRRLAIWEQYHAAFAELEAQRKVQRPVVPAACRHNAHIYYLLMPDLASRTALIEQLQAAGMRAVFHYVPLHSAPAGRKYGRAHGALTQTQAVSHRLVRLPLWVGMSEEDVVRVVEGVYTALQGVQTSAVA